MSDIISRQGAINAFKRRRVYHYDTIADILSDLPSVWPLVLTCDGCRHVGTYDTDFPCSGCIRREKDYYEQER